MLRFELKLLSLDDATNEADAQVIEASNKRAEHSFRHLKKLLGNKVCRKHPSSPNKIKVFAVKGGDPTASLVSTCCPDFTKQIK